MTALDDIDDVNDASSIPASGKSNLTKAAENLVLTFVWRGVTGIAISVIGIVLTVAIPRVLDSLNAIVVQGATIVNMGEAIKDIKEVDKKQTDQIAMIADRINTEDMTWFTKFTDMRNDFLQQIGGQHTETKQLIEALTEGQRGIVEREETFRKRLDALEVKAGIVYKDVQALRCKVYGSFSPKCTQTD